MIYTINPRDAQSETLMKVGCESNNSMSEFAAPDKSQETSRARHLLFPERPSPGCAEICRQWLKPRRKRSCMSRMHDVLPPCGCRSVSLETLEDTYEALTRRPQRTPERRQVKPPKPDAISYNAIITVRISGAFLFGSHWACQFWAACVSACRGCGLERGTHEAVGGREARTCLLEPLLSL